MGQYHDLCRLDQPQELEHYTLGAGAKAWEQIGGTGMMAGLALICAKGFGQHPRDLPWAPKGTWAGKPLASIGDYAGDDDLIDHPILGRSDDTMEQTYRGQRKRNVATQLVPTIERVCKVRSVGTGWITMAGPIDRLADGTWGLVRTKWAATCTDEEWTNHVAYMGRVDQGSASWKRAPAPLKGAPDSVPSVDEVGAGGAALWISIDAREYIDTAALGAPDLAAVLEKGAGTSFVQSALFHNDHRGGGDVDNGHGLHVVGRWRGDRIALVGPKGVRIDGALLTHDAIRATYTDVTGLARLADLLMEKDFNRPTPAQDTPPSWSNRAQQAILAPFLDSWVPKGGMDHPIVQHTVLQVYPALTVALDGEVVSIPASAQLLHNGDGVVWLAAEERARFKAAFADLPPLEGTGLLVKTARGNGQTVEANWPAPVRARLLDGVNAHTTLTARNIDA
jgi:hypothetical protein